MKISRILTAHLHRLWQDKGPVSTALLPLSWLVRGAIELKRRRHAGTRFEGSPPVIVVGNLYVGGTGKTPVVIALVQGLQALGWRPGVISRGYGARIGTRARFGEGFPSPSEVGDEPALIARTTGAPLAVHPRRVRALETLLQRRPDVDIVVSDDGLQHLALPRDIEFVVQDGRGLGNRRLLPAGPLREPADRLLTIDYLVTNLGWGEEAPAAVSSPAMRITMRLAPTFMRHLSSQKVERWETWKARHLGQTVAAVAGIGRPDRYFHMLRAMGLRVQHTVALPDHYDYSATPFADLQTELVLVTSKDAVKLDPVRDDRLWEVCVEPVFAPAGWLQTLDQRLRTAKSIKL